MQLTKENGVNVNIDTQRVWIYDNEITISTLECVVSCKRCHM